MKDSFRFYSADEVLALTVHRAGEVKIGEKVQTMSSFHELKDHNARFVVFGIPEDIGVRANGGIAGAKNTWKPALTAFLNTQSNVFLSGEEIIIAGEFDIAEVRSTDLSVLREAVAAIDRLVMPIVQQVVAAGKVPIIIGGGHNNAFPIISGFASAQGDKTVAVVNIDAHADLRELSEGRHSGNGFSTAMAKGLVSTYSVFGLQKAYNNQSIISRMEKDPSITAVWYDDIPANDLERCWTELIAAVNAPCGLEVDMDAIAHMLSSAVSPTGFSLDQVRHMARTHKTFAYLHICEGAVSLEDGRRDPTVAKAVALLIRDFIIAQTT